jgi:hypothetical protein
MPTPAEIVIERFGGPEKVAAALGLSRSRVYRWTRPRTRGGSDGLIPAKHQAPLLAAARRRRIALEPADLIPAQRASRRQRDGTAAAPEGAR